MINLTFFDLDHTLLAGDSDYEWGRFLTDEGIVDRQEYGRTNEYFHAQYEAGHLDIHAFQRFVLAPLLEHSPAQMEQLRQRYVETRIRPIVARHAEALIAYHRQRGDKLAIITATNRFITQPIAALLGIDTLIATEPEIVDGAYTGEITGTPCYQDGKIERATDWIQTQGVTFGHIQCYSDSHNDLPLLRWADTAVAVDPDAHLKTAAEASGWAVISLRGDQPPSLG